MNGQADKADRRTSWTFAGKFLFALLFVAGGIAHFAAPAFYLRLMPPYLPYHRALVLLSGGIEVALGVMLLIPWTSRLAAWGLIALLIAVFPANLHVFQHQDQFPLPWVVHFLRLPAQGLLIWWAYAYTGRAGPVRPPLAEAA